LETRASPNFFIAAAMQNDLTHAGRETIFFNAFPVGSQMEELIPLISKFTKAMSEGVSSLPSEIKEPPFLNGSA